MFDYVKLCLVLFACGALFGYSLRVVTEALFND